MTTAADATPIWSDPAELMEHFTALQMHCPDCDGLMVGARIFDAAEQEAFVGVVCRPCDKAYHVGNGVTL